MKTLVTGGAGFIGSNLVDALVARGDDVAVIDDLSTGKRENLEPRARRRGRADRARHPRRRGRAPPPSSACGPEVDLPPRRPDRRAQVGGRPGPRLARERRGHDQRAERRARPAGVRRVVNTSTGGAIYGEGQIIPAPEDHPVAPEAPYGLSKFCAENYCALFTRLHGLSTVSLRYGNVYGPRQDPLGEAGVIAIFCGKLLEGGRPTDLRRRQADARLRLRRRRRGRQPARGRLRRHRRVQRRPRRADERARHRRGARARSPTTASRPTTRPRAPGEVQHIALDASRAKAELGWEAQVDLDQGLARTLDSLR